MFLFLFIFLRSFISTTRLIVFSSFDQSPSGLCAIAKKEKAPARRDRLRFYFDFLLRRISSIAAVPLAYERKIKRVTNWGI